MRKGGIMSIDNKKLKECPVITDISVTDKGEIRIKWTKVEGAEKYAVRRAEKHNAESVHLAWAKEGEYIDKTAQKDVTYWYRIHAVKTLKDKKTSKKISALAARVYSDIPAPDGISAECKGDKISLRWNKAQGADSYVVYRRNEYFNQLLPLCKVDENCFVDGNAVSGQTYHYSVQSISGDSHGNFSKEVTCVSLDPGEILEAKARLFRKVELKARIVAGADGYVFECSEDGKSFEKIGETDSDVSLRFTHKVQKAFSVYYYRVRAYKNVCGKTFFSKPSKAVKVKTK